jgi:hypothetical protein
VAGVAAGLALENIQRKTTEYRHAMGMTHKSLDDRAVERRTGDRRSTSTYTLSGALFKCRRRNSRRHLDEVNSYTDWYGPWPLVATLLITILCCVDAFLTLILLDKGAVELNLLMDILIQTDTQLFTIVKVAVTGLALVILVLHFNFRVYRVIAVRYLIYAIVPMYMLLIAHEINMLYSI